LTEDKRGERERKNEEQEKEGIHKYTHI
jgi:hypothetical protein